MTSIVEPRRSAVVALAVCLGCLSWAQGSVAPAADVYATFGTTPGSSGYEYGFGTFDLANPTGSPGAYTYAWTTLRSPAAAVLANVAMEPGSGSMVVEYEFSQFRSISTAGVLSGSLGPTSAYWGMAFDTAGDLYAFSPSGAPWLNLDPANGQALTEGGLVGDVAANDIYSTFGGNLAARPAGGFFMVNQSTVPELVRFGLVDPDAATLLTGTFAGTGFDPLESGLSLFASGSSLFLLSGSSLFSVDESNAALTKLGDVSGLPGNFAGFTGATSLVVAVPEPATLGLVAFGGTLMAARRLRRSRRSGAVARSR